MQALLALDDAALEAAMAERFQQRLGAMRVAGPRCAYPLVGVYAKRFVAERFALIGDAAVGMHPVTAHGFNFGLRSEEHTSELQSLMRISYAVFCLKKKKKAKNTTNNNHTYENKCSHMYRIIKNMHHV